MDDLMSCKEGEKEGQWGDCKKDQTSLVVFCQLVYIQAITFEFKIQCQK